jgi:hypothetical protein
VPAVAALVPAPPPTTPLPPLAVGGPLGSSTPEHPNADKRQEIEIRVSAEERRFIV